MPEFALVRYNKDGIKPPIQRLRTFDCSRDKAMQELRREACLYFAVNPRMEGLCTWYDGMAFYDYNPFRLVCVYALQPQTTE